MKQICALLVLALLIGCSAHGVRGIADKRTDFRKFLPMTGDPGRYDLKAVKPYFQRANRAQLLRAIENACQDRRKHGSSFFNPETQSGYYVNCNPENRQLLNGYIPANPSEAPHSRP
jgi:hypothetical protein